MRGFNPGSIFTFIFILMIMGSVGKSIPFFLPMIIFFFVARSFSKKNESEKKRGHVRESTRRRRTQQRERRDFERRPNTRRAPVARKKQNNPFKKSGVDKFKDFDYEGAIEDFTRALQIDQNDPAVHFNLACAYSLMEKKDQAFESLSNAAQLGFKDVEKIKTHDALAYLRVQDDFDRFMENGLRWPLGRKKSSTAKSSSTNPDLLQQLKQLAELREKGLLTNEEFLIQKKRLLG